jgi:hypothetical protein
MNLTRIGAQPRGRWMEKSEAAALDVATRAGRISIASSGGARALRPRNFDGFQLNVGSKSPTISGGRSEIRQIPSQELKPPEHTRQYPMMGLRLPIAR